jgi:chromosome segregation ATPase
VSEITAASVDLERARMAIERLEREITAASVDLERARMAIERLERENAALRRQVLETGHRASVLASRCKSCDFHPDVVAANAETKAIVRKSREHA